MTMNPQISNLFQNIFQNFPFRILWNQFTNHTRIILITSCQDMLSVFFSFPSFTLIPNSPVIIPIARGHPLFSWDPPTH